MDKPDFLENDRRQLNLSENTFRTTYNTIGASENAKIREIWLIRLIISPN